MMILICDSIEFLVEYFSGTFVSKLLRINIIRRVMCYIFFNISYYIRAIETAC